MNDATIERIARKQAGEVIQPSKVVIDGIQVQQRLCRMFVVAISCINKRNAGSISRDLGRTCPVMAQHDSIRIRLKGTHGILKRLTFTHR